jgi:hypothetical protein
MDDARILDLGGGRKVTPRPRCIRGLLKRVEERQHSPRKEREWNTRRSLFTNKVPRGQEG